jgi:hypothetical protein
MMSRLGSQQPDASQRGVVVEKPKFSIYTMLLLLSLIAIVIGCVCLAMEMKAYDWDFKAR